ncbi:unnamed protein product [Leptidea sinapis]|uniref:Protein-lysine N-methyltransferase SMYD4 n=1 Tax=Leptidea sinapis TaxID=189913 RepID=A0A5E4Q7E3_9NEOP|nr:unnamed protein product [Leptidea sinapis]
MIIDELYENVIQKLTSDGKINQISEVLATCVNNEERVLLLFQIITDLDYFPQMKVFPKTDEMSKHYRLQGNHYYTKRDNHKALQYYNVSLLTAPLNSESFATALSNRSAVLFALKKYKDCIQDINLFFTLKHPVNLKDKLIKRKELCEEGLKRVEEEKENPEISDILTFTSDKNDRYLCASSKLEVVYNKEMGRHVVAKENIKVGEMVAEEEPYFPLLLKSQILFSCSYCLSRQCHLIPCNTCCFALYCNEECRERAWKEYHKVECCLMATFISMSFTKIELFALRTVIKARTDHSDWDGLYLTIEEAEANINTKNHGCVKIGDKWIYDSKYYASIHTLETNVDKRSASDIFQKAVTSAIFLNFLSENTDFLNADTVEEEAKATKCVAGLLLLHAMTTPTNMHGISANSDTYRTGTYTDVVSLASAAYAFHSLLNHSCAPNIVRFTKLGTATITSFALRPIAKGTQIFDNYGSHHAIADKVERQSCLRYQYKFACMCEACVYGWPTYISMRPSKRLPTKVTRSKSKYLSHNIIEKLQCGDKETAIKVFRRLCSLCMELESYAPCMELCDCQEGLKQCLSIFEGLIPYGFSTSIEWHTYQF